MEKGKFDVTKAIGHKYPSYRVEVKNNDMILYALSIGFSRDPLNKEHFKFTYENSDNFTSFTTLPVVVSHKQLGIVTTTPNLPEINPMMILHGEENLEVFKPLAAGMKVQINETLVDVQDKGSGAALIMETEIVNIETKEVHAKILTTIFARGVGGFGYKGKIK